MCSVIEPDTSIRQNITACATGRGIGSNRLIADVERIDVRDQPGAPQLARQFRFQFDRGALRSPIAARARRFRRATPAVRRASAVSARSAATASCAPCALQREVGRRAGDRIAGAVPGHAIRIQRPCAWPDRAAPDLPGTDRRTRRATGRSGNRPRPRRPGCLRSRRRLRRPAGAEWCRRSMYSLLPGSR